MNRKLVLVLAGVLLLSAVALSALPKVAVLDAVISDGMDKSVIVPITDKIAEQIVASKQYSVLDRANVEQVLREKEFQVSGMVQDSDIKQAGKYLGADFVVVARVSLVDNTYFISAKMINVETGAVTTQVSDQQEGRAAVLISIAERVGKKLVGASGGTVVETPKDTTAEDAKKAAAEKAAAEKAAAGKAVQPVAVTPATTKPRPRSTITVEAGAPFFFGDLPDAAADWVDYNMYSAGYDYADRKVGVAMRAAFFVLPFLYIGGSIEHGQNMVLFVDYDETMTVYSGSGLMLHTGYGAALGSALQLYAGVKLGYSILMLGDYWASRDGETASGFSYGVEVGAEVILFRRAVLSARLDWTSVSFAEGSSDIDYAFFDTTSITGYYYDSPYSYNRIGISVGVGIALGK